MLNLPHSTKDRGLLAFKSWRPFQAHITRQRATPPTKRYPYRPSLPIAEAVKNSYALEKIAVIVPTMPPTVPTPRAFVSPTGPEAVENRKKDATPNIRMVISMPIIIFTASYMTFSFSGGPNLHWTAFHWTEGSNRVLMQSLPG